MFALYRKGHTHYVPTADGTSVQCEVVRVPLEQIEDFKKEGWTDDIEDLRTSKSEVKPKAPEKLTEKQKRQQKVEQAVEESHNRLDEPVKQEVINAPVEPNGKNEEKDPDHI